MNTVAVVLTSPANLELSRIALTPPGDADIVVDMIWSGISTGTERLLYEGRMPMFPGMGYPLVPGYESVGRVVDAGAKSGLTPGQTVFVPGARCYGDVRGLFGGAASRVVLPGSRATAIDAALGDKATLFALAATAQHAIAAPHAELPDLVVGHGVLGRMLARLAVSAGGAPTVWETNPGRRAGAEGYSVVDPASDPRRDYRAIYDVSGDSKLLDQLVGRLAPGGEIVLAGFYVEPLGFAFAPAFMREARIRIAAQWQDADLAAVTRLVGDGRLSLDGLITHHSPAGDARVAYETAFGDASCLKMILDWSALA